MSFFRFFSWKVWKKGQGLIFQHNFLASVTRSGYGYLLMNFWKEQQYWPLKSIPSYKCLPTFLRILVGEDTVTHHRIRFWVRNLFGWLPIPTYLLAGWDRVDEEVDREGVEREAAGAKGAAEQHPRGQKGELMLIRDTYVIFFRYLNMAPLFMWVDSA